jgi:hypothetical protein
VKETAFTATTSIRKPAKPINLTAKNMWVETRKYSLLCFRELVADCLAILAHQLGYECHALGTPLHLGKVNDRLRLVSMHFKRT